MQPRKFMSSFWPTVSRDRLKEPEEISLGVDPKEVESLLLMMRDGL
jgi:hypothetical protein